VPSPSTSRASLLALARLLIAASLLASTALARERVDVGEIRVERLPHEAREVLVQIRAGGPFRFERDGVTFGNRERSLPSQHRGYYHEYTVVTPGLRTRGARRIVCGGPRRAPEVCYYTDDHYQTFRRIRE
jgi:ribonuclease T1